MNSKARSEVSGSATARVGMESARLSHVPRHGRAARPPRERPTPGLFTT